MLKWIKHFKSHALYMTFKIYIFIAHFMIGYYYAITEKAAVEYSLVLVF